MTPDKFSAPWMFLWLYYRTSKMIQPVHAGFHSGKIYIWTTGARFAFIDSAPEGIKLLKNDLKVKRAKSA